MIFCGEIDISSFNIAYHDACGYMEKPSWLNDSCDRFINVQLFMARIINVCKMFDRYKSIKYSTIEAFKQVLMLCQSVRRKNFCAETKFLLSFRKICMSLILSLLKSNLSLENEYAKKFILHKKLMYDDKNYDVVQNVSC